MKVYALLIGLIFFTSIVGSAQQRLGPSQQDSNLARTGSTLQSELDQFWIDSHGDAEHTWHSGGKSTDTTVSIEQLQHKVPKQAWKEYTKGRKASIKGDYESALNHLQNTIQLDPQFANGHNDLGVVLTKLGNIAEAAEEFQRAVNLAPHDTVPLQNLCVTIYLMGHYRDVVPLARRALKSDQTLLYVRYVLGMSLFAVTGDGNEALRNLELAAPNIPQARLVAARILLKAGRRDDAVLELKTFLRSAPNTDPRRADAELLLAGLRN